MNENGEKPDHLGGNGGGTGSVNSSDEYPCSGSRKMVRRAVSENWIEVVDERMPEMVETLIDIVLDTESSPREKKGCFTALNQAVHQRRQLELAGIRNDLAEARHNLVTFHHQQRSELLEASKGETTRADFLDPRDVAVALIEMQNAIEPPPKEPTQENEE